MVTFSTANIARELWDELSSAGGGALDEQADDRVKQLRTWLDLPSPDENMESIAYPIPNEQNKLLLFEPKAGRYSARAVKSVDSGPKVILETNKGSLLLDPDDPLARAKKGVERLKSIS